VLRAITGDVRCGRDARPRRASAESADSRLLPTEPRHILDRLDAFSCGTRVLMRHPRPPPPLGVRGWHGVVRFRHRPAELASGDPVDGTTAGRWSGRRAGRRSSRLRELIASLAKTLCRWYCTIRALMNSRLPISDWTGRRGPAARSPPPEQSASRGCRPSASGRDSRWPAARDRRARPHGRLNAKRANARPSRKRPSRPRRPGARTPLSARVDRCGVNGQGKQWKGSPPHEIGRRWVPGGHG
jgi:hypothetical protein